MLKREAQVVKLVDTRDLKSLGLNIRAGSTPALGTNKQLLAAFVVSGPYKISKSPTPHPKHRSTSIVASNRRR